MEDKHFHHPLDVYHAGIHSWLNSTSKDPRELMDNVFLSVKMVGTKMETTVNDAFTDLQAHAHNHQ